MVVVDCWWNKRLKIEIEPVYDKDGMLCFRDSIRKQ